MAKLIDAYTFQLSEFYYR